MSRVYSESIGLTARLIDARRIIVIRPNISIRDFLYGKDIM